MTRLRPLLLPPGLTGGPGMALALIKMMKSRPALVTMVSRSLIGALASFGVAGAAEDAVPRVVAAFPLASGDDISGLTAMGGVLYFTRGHVDRGAELWRSDGTAAGTRLVKMIREDPSDTTMSSAPPLLAVGDQLLFCANDGVHGQELWRSDGTAAGTGMVMEIYPGTYYPGAIFNGPAVLGGVLYFTGWDPVNGTQPWRSDGTAAGTSRIRNANDSLSSETLGPFTAAEGQIYFSAGLSGIGPYHIYRGDGSLVVEVPGRNPFAVLPVVMGGAVYVRVNQQATGRELWRYTGAGGLAIVKDLNPGTSGSFPTDAGVPPTAASDWILLRANDGESVKLFAVRSTGDPVQLLQGEPDFFDPSKRNPINIEMIAAEGRRIFFYAASLQPVGGMGLWVSDGTVAGTRVVRNFGAGANRMWMTTMMTPPVKGGFYFCTKNEMQSSQLWRSDGTPEGTVMVASHIGDSQVATIGSLTKLGRKLYYLSGRQEGPLWELCVVDLPPTEVKTAVAAGVSHGGSTALLGGDATLATDQGTAYFQWGETTAYGAQTPAVAVEGMRALWQQQVTGLVPGRTYHFRAAVHDGEETVYGPDRVFTAGSLYSIWLAGYPELLAAEEEGGNEDIDRDGMTNVEEYAYGTSPLVAEHGSLVLSAAGNSLAKRGRPMLVRDAAGDGFRFIYVQRKGDAGLSCGVQISVGLDGWQPSTAEPQVLVDDGEYQVLSVGVDALAGRGFVRLSVEAGAGAAH